MLAIHPTCPQKTTPNLLPCRINHNGPIHSAPRFWTPVTEGNGTQHVHFRGRHLHGTSVPLPENYSGAIVNVTDKTLPASSSHPLDANRRDDDDDDEAEEDADMHIEEVRIAEQTGTFDEIMIWEHGGKVDVESSAFVRGLGEWVRFAEGMHCDDEEEKGENARKET